MRKRVFKTFAAAALATTIAGTTIIGSTAFADEISTLTQQKQDKQNELDQLQQQAAYLLTEMSSLEQDMADLSDEIDQTNADLEAAQQLQQKQFDDTKLRIKYMYEDQSTSISDVMLLIRQVICSRYMTMIVTSLKRWLQQQHLSLNIKVI